MVRALSFTWCWISARFGNASYAGKTSNEALVSYCFGLVACNGMCEDALDHVVGEPAAREQSGTARRVSRFRRCPHCAPALGLDRGERCLYRLRGHATSFEIGADPHVAVATFGEPGGSVAGEAAVVDVADTLERLDGLRPCGLGDPCAGKLRPELRGGVIASGERLDGTLDRGLTLGRLVRRHSLGLDRLLRLLGRGLGAFTRNRGGSRRLLLGGRRLVAGVGHGQQPGGSDLILSELCLDPSQDRLRDVGMLAEERGRVLAALAEPLVLEAEVRARLLDDLALEPCVEHSALPGDALAVEDVELRLLEGRSDLVLRHLDPHP